MSYQPTKPTEPATPIEPPNRRPGVVTLAAALLVIGVVWGLVLSVSYFIGAGQISDEFRRRAAGTTATPTQIDSIVAAIRSLFSLGGIISLLLAALIALLAVGVLRGNNAARVTTVVLIVIAICSGAGFGSGTAITSRAEWAVNVNDANAQLAQDLGQAYADSVPGWMVGVATGFVCLQLLGYIAVVVLLFLPVSNRFFRRRARATPSSGVTMTPPPPPNAPPGPPPGPPPGSPDQPPMPG